MKKIAYLILILLLWSPVESANVILTIDKNKVPIYATPDVKSKVMVKLESGLILKAIGMNNEKGIIFYKVILPSGKFGWVCENDLLIQERNKE